MSQTATRPERRPPSDTPAAAKQVEATWGFAEPKREKVIEPRLGLALGLCLAIMFGFVLYSKYQTIQTVAAKESQPPSAVNEDELTVSEQSLEEADPSLRSTRSPNQISQPELIANSAAEGAPNPFGGPASTWNAPSQPTGETVTTSSSEEVNPFGWGEDHGSMAEETSSGPPPQAEPNPFGDFAAPESRTVASDDAFHQGFEGEELNSDSRQTPAVASPSPPDEPTWNFAEAPQANAITEPDPDPFASDPPSLPAASEEEMASAGEEPHPFSSPQFAARVPHTEPVPEQGDFSEPLETSDDWQATPDDAAFAPPASAAQEVLEPTTEWATNLHPRGPDAHTAEVNAPALPSLPPPSPLQQPAPDEGWDLQAPPNPSPFEISQSEPSTPLQKLPLDKGLNSFPTAELTAPSVGADIRAFFVSRNDSLWSIAETVYGTGRYATALARYNQDRVPHPDKLPVGTTLRIPPAEVLESQYPDLFPGRLRRDPMVSTAGATQQSGASPEPGYFEDADGSPHYRVAAGDTLSHIARLYLGRSSRWAEIQTLNQDQLPAPEALKPGMVLRLPRDSPTGSISTTSGIRP